MSARRGGDAHSLWEGSLGPMAGSCSGAQISAITPLSVVLTAPEEGARGHSLAK
jgi:hypothetical protein